MLTIYNQGMSWQNGHLVPAPKTEAGVKATMALAEDLYKAAGAEGNCALVVGAEGHRFYADDAWPVMNAFMKK